MVIADQRIANRIAIGVDCVRIVGVRVIDADRQASQHDIGAVSQEFQVELMSSTISDQIYADCFGFIFIDGKPVWRREFRNA